MYKYLISFIVGTKEVVLEALESALPNIKIIYSDNEYALFESSQLVTDTNRLPFVDQFYFIFFFNKKNAEIITHKTSIDNIDNHDNDIELLLMRLMNSSEFAQKLRDFDNQTRGTYRVVESARNHDKKMYRGLVYDLEEKIQWNRLVKIDRGHPKFEIRIVSKENFSFAGIRLSAPPEYKGKFERNSIDSYLANIMLQLSEINSVNILWDPFCGGGIIPLLAIQNFRVHKVYASDKNVDLIKEKIKGKGDIYKNLIIKQGRFEDLQKDFEKVDRIVTDPPWGKIEEISDINEFYTNLLKIMSTKLNKNGIVVMLTSKEILINQVIDKQTFLKVDKQFNIVVSGKSAIIWKLKLL